MTKYAIGIDLGGRSAKFGLFTEDSKLISKSNIVTRIEEDGKYILTDIYDHILKIIDKYQLNEENLLGIGMGVPGSVLNQNFVSAAVNLGWKDVDLKDFFKDKFSYKILADNDANVAALGESWQGAGKEFSSMIMVTLGTGVGGGIILDNKILSGVTGSAGEIGHMPILETPISRTCGCGGNRCLELVASATGIEELANEYLFDNDEESILRRLDTISAKDVFEAYKNGDKIASIIADKFFKYLGRGLAILGSVIDPQAFVLGGGVSNAGDILLDGVKKSYKAYAYSVVKDKEFRLATLGNDAGIYGAAKLVL